METVISEQIAKYLESLGEGTLGIDLFYDYNPDDESIDTTAVYDLGGNPQQSTQTPSGWREIHIQIRCKKHADGYAKIWRILNAVLYPAEGSMVIGTDAYFATLRDIPAIDDRDKNGRYLFGFTVVAQRVVTVSDPWLTMLVNWSQDVLGPDWAVYAGLGGGKYPQLVWSMVDYETEDAGRGLFRVTKTFTGNVSVLVPDDLYEGINIIVERLGIDVKILLDAGQRKYVTASDIGANIRAGELLEGTISVTLGRLTSRPREEAPIITAIHYTQK